MHNMATNLPEKMVIVLGGPGGSGRTSLAEKLTEMTGLRRIYGGGMLRQIAFQLGYGEPDPNTGNLTFTEEKFIQFHHEYVPLHPEVDLKIDSQLFEMAFEGGVIIESMTFAPLATRCQFPYLKVWVTADEEERVRRLIEREAKNGLKVGAAEMQDLLRQRTAANQKRYQALYGFDYLHVGEYYDFTFDTTKVPREEMASQLLNMILERTSTHR